MSNKLSGEKVWIRNDPMSVWVLVNGGCCFISGTGSVTLTSQAGHALGRWGSSSAHMTHASNLRPPVWYLSLKLKLLRRAVASAIVQLSPEPLHRDTSGNNRERNSNLCCRSYRSCSKLSAVTWEGGLACECSGGFKVSPHGKGLMEGKGEQGEHNWSLSGWEAWPAGWIKYVISNDISADRCNF